jgi:hypothetical protein
MRVKLAMLELGIDCEMVPVDLTKGEQANPRLNPFGARRCSSINAIAQALTATGMTRALGNERGLAAGGLLGSAGKSFPPGVDAGGCDLRDGFSMPAEEQADQRPDDSYHCRG